MIILTLDLQEKSKSSLICIHPQESFFSQFNALCIGLQSTKTEGNLWIFHISTVHRLRSWHHVDCSRYWDTRKKEENFSPGYPVTWSVQLSMPEAAMFLEFYKVWRNSIDNYLLPWSANVRLFNTLHLRHQNGNTVWKNSSRLLQACYPALKWGPWIYLLVPNLVLSLDLRFFYSLHYLLTFILIFHLLSMKSLS